MGQGIAVVAGMMTQGSEAAIVSKKPSTGSGEIGPQLKLSCCAYSIRECLPQKNKPGKISLSDYLDLAAAWGLDGVELTSYYFTSEEPRDMFELKAKAFKLGLDVSGTAVGNNFVQPAGDGRANEINLVKRWVDRAVDLGAPCVRIFAGHKSDGDRKDHFNWVVESIKGCMDYAGDKGIFLALENHGYLTETAPDALEILAAVNHEWLGLNLDTGNFVADPYKNIELAVPQAITTHVKTTVRTTDGSGSEPADYARLVRILREANYRGYLSLEYEDDADQMTGVPTALAEIRKAING